MTNVVRGERGERGERGGKLITLIIFTNYNRRDDEYP
jgi:hypothetical protein